MVKGLQEYVNNIQPLLTKIVETDEKDGLDGKINGQSIFNQEHEDLQRLYENYIDDEGVKLMDKLFLLLGLFRKDQSDNRLDLRTGNNEIFNLQKQSSPQNTITAPNIAPPAAPRSASGVSELINRIHSLVAQLGNTQPTTGITPNPPVASSAPVASAQAPAQATNSSIGEKAAQIAESQVGVGEAGNGHLKYTGGKNEAWCAHFVSWAWEQANGGEAPWGHQAAVKSIREWGQQNGRYIRKEEAQGKVKAGDIVIYEDNGRSHTAIVTKVNPDGTFDVVGGNEGNEVRKSKLTLNNSELSGFVIA